MVCSQLSLFEGFLEACKNLHKSKYNTVNKAENKQVQCRAIIKPLDMLNTKKQTLHNNALMHMSNI